MALNRDRSAAAPLWLTVLFGAGLVLLYVGQRVVVKWDGFATLVSWGAVFAMLASTAARFLPALRGKGARAEIARVLDGLQLLGLIGVGLYFLASSSLIVADGASGEAARWSQALGVAWVLCVSVSLAGLVFAELALHPMRDALHLEGRRVRAAAASGVALALAASYGALFVYAAAQQEAQADFSYFKTSEPGEATVKLVQQSGRPIQVTAFFPRVNEVRKEVEGYLQILARRSGNLEVRITDRYLEPKLASELDVIADGVVVLRQDDGTQTLNVGTKLDKARQKLTKFDREFYGKLVRLVNSRRTAYLTTGHGELNDPERGTARAEGRSADVVKELLEQQNYRVRDLGLGQGLGREVPDDASLVLVLGPTLPFAPEEIATLKRYAESGGKLLMALDADASSTAAGAEADHSWLRELASAVGADFVPTVLADAQNHVVRNNDPSDRVILATNRFSSHASVSTLSRNSSRAGVVVLGAGHLLETEADAGRPTVALRSLPTAFNDDDRSYDMGAGEETKAYNLAVALTRTAPALNAADVKAPLAQPTPPHPELEANGGAAGVGTAAEEAAAEEAAAGEAADGEPGVKPPDTPQEMRAFVLADADALSDLLMGRVVGNQMLLVDAVRWLVGEESLAGEFSTEEDVRIEHTKQEDLAWFYSTIFGVPALVLGLGIWISRRGKASREQGGES